MGRSVSTPHNATAVAYLNFEPEYPDDCQHDWDDLVEWIKDTAADRWPSLEDCDQWIGREDHAILENGHAYIGVSEYCGLVAVWLVPKEDNGYSHDHSALADRWCSQIASRFRELFGTLRSIGTASNGEQFFERVQS